MKGPLRHHKPEQGFNCPEGDSPSQPEQAHTIERISAETTHHITTSMIPKTILLAIAIGTHSIQVSTAEQVTQNPSLEASSLAAAATVQPDTEINIEMVLIENPKNDPDPIRKGLPTGRVNYPFAISKFEITNAQYAAFLNSIAKDDTNSVFKDGVTSTYRWNHNGTPNAEPFILRSGEPGAYVYQVKPGYEDLPVWGVSWFDAARFVNWLHNGKPQGVQSDTTTEDGAYPLRGRSSGVDIPRQPKAIFWLPNADEWHKAAYHNPTLPKNDAYKLFATGSNEEIQEAKVNGLLVTNPGPDTIAKGHLRHPIDVGACESKSAYGVHDMMGNVQEWTDTVIVNKHRGVRGGGVRSAVKKDEIGIGSDPTNTGMTGIRIAGKPGE